MVWGCGAGFAGVDVAAAVAAAIAATIAIAAAGDSGQTYASCL